MTTNPANDLHLLRFVKARLGEDESMHQSLAFLVVDGLGMSGYLISHRRLARNLAAGRALVEAYENAPPAEFPDYDGGYLSGLEKAVEQLAGQWADNPDYDLSWGEQ